MEKAHVLRGLATINFYATDHQAAKKWYTELLGIEPYFSVPGYTEFRIGDYQHELGIIDSSGGKGNFVTASVVDLFGNIFGIMTNVHYLEILQQKNV